MSLSVQTLFERAQRSYKSQASSGTFAADFVDALNSVLDDLSFAADLATPITHVESHETSISVLDARHMNIVKTGLDVYLKDFGNMNPKVGPAMFVNAQRDWEDKKGEFMVMTSHDDQNDDLDDDGNPEVDIIGLGVKG